MDIVELAKRCGLRPADADANINFDGNRGLEKTYALSFSWRAHDDDPNLQKFRRLIDMQESDQVWAADICDLEDRVQRALQLAPRARAGR